MANNSIALGVDVPNFGNSFNQGAEAAQGRQLNSLRMDATRQGMQQSQEEHGRKQALELMQLLGSAGMYALNGQIDGEVDPAKWGEAMDGLASFGFDSAQYKDKPQLASALVASSLSTSDRIKMAKDDRAFEQTLREFDADLAYKAQSLGLRREEVDLKRQELAGNAGGEFRFGGKSVEAQALNGLMDAGKLTPEQAQQLGAGKTITGSHGEVIFMTPQGVFGQPADGGEPRPLDGRPSGNIPITEPKVTVDEKKAMTFADRMAASGKIIDAMGTKGSGKVDQVASGVPGVGEYLTSDDFKKVDQAKRDFVNAQLRRESGAVISDEEFDNANKQYFPQPNDPPEVLEQKKRNRQVVIEGMVRDAGPTYGRGSGADEDPLGIR